MIKNRTMHCDTLILYARLADLLGSMNHASLACRFRLGIGSCFVLTAGCNAVHCFDLGCC